MKVWVPVRKDLNNSTQVDLGLNKGRLLCPGEGATDLYEIEVKDEDQLKSLTFIHGEPLLPKFSVGTEITYLGLRFTVIAHTFHAFDRQWIIGYRIANPALAEILVLEFQLKRAM